MTEEQAIYESARENVSKLSKLVLEEQCLLSGIESIRWWHYRDLSKKFQNLIPLLEKTSDSSKKVFSGFVKKMDDFFILFVNDSIESVERKNFTFCHELYHYLHHFGIGLGDEFNDLISESHYSEKLDPIELEANYGASLMMCSDEALLYGLAHQWSSYDFFKNMRMSSSAIKSRIVNYLRFNCGIPKERAKSLAGAFIKGEKKERRTFLNILIPNWSSFDEKFRNIESFKPLANGGFETFYHTIGAKTTTASHFHQAQHLFLDMYLEPAYKCTKCKAIFKDDFEYCPICSAKKSFKHMHLNKYSGGNEMEYSKIEMNNQKTPLRCPRCEAEHLDDNFQYCPYCSTFLHNVCLGNEHNKFVQTFEGTVELTLVERFERNDCSKEFLDGGFRYCPTCGSKTSFFEQQLLKDWSAEKNDLPF
ncbi:ImmA/IrrE family metallo-endopeptidase [Enterococcus asini]|uniref:ImmA/IrrE family metallo-endopeptidase n=1 Tax=Enterococcus asini TaxID=57732 RepID=UPI00288D7E41|nr:ImmA/IrrE family metallo-endopeptidase [Enterococcus asini]MDT2743978.1 ImmA/IrrE family metallo-endopeptidase [Enterococcus asini]